MLRKSIEMLRSSRQSRWMIPAALAALLASPLQVSPRSAAAQSPAASSTDASPSAEAAATEHPDAQSLQFSFDRATWRDVMSWLAEQSDLALHFDQLPTGTFTYTDPGRYSPADAIDRINMFLIPEGFAAVRSGGLLSVINLQDTRSLQKLDAMARLVQPDDLAGMAGHEIVKCLFDTDRLPLEQVAAEIRELNLMVEPVLLESSDQLLVTDTAAKLQSVARVIAGARAAAEGYAPAVKPYRLEHVALEDFLEVARPHLGIEPGQNRSAEINISTDATGKNLYASGTQAALTLLEQLLAAVDRPEAGTADVSGQVLKSHPVRGESLATVYDVLQTMLADKPIRLSTEPSSGSIIALADPSIQATIEQTIAEVEGVGSEFAIIQLKTVDPYFAITLLNEMFDLAEEPQERSWRRGWDDDDDDDAAPKVKIDADPKGMRLFVRGPANKVAEIRDAVDRLDNEETQGGERVIPIFGARATGVLRAASQTWDGKNPIRDLPATGIRASIRERVVNADNPRGETGRDRSAVAPASPDRDARAEEVDDAVVPAGFVSSRNRASSPAQAIEAQVTPRGIVLQSDDPKALQNFESHLRDTAQSGEASAVETVIYYLKYATANEGARMLADLLDGATSVVHDASQAALVNSYVPAADASQLFGSYLLSGEGSTVVTSGTLSVIADSRLNRLICIGTQEDLALVEQYLEVIDKDTSLTDVEIYGSSHVIELVNTRAEEVANVIRDSYGDRVSLTSKQKLDQQAAQSSRGREGGEGERQAVIQTSRNQEPQMSVAIHEGSNSLVVTAPDPLFEEVELLVKKLDEQAAQTVEVIYYPSAEGVQMLQNALGGGGGGSSGGRQSDRRSR